MKKVAWNVFLEIGGRAYRATVMAETPELARQKARNGIKISKVAPKDTWGVFDSDDPTDKQILEWLGITTEDMR